MQRSSIDSNSVRPSFHDLESTRERLEDLSRRHERFPYALWEVAEAGQNTFSEIKKAQAGKSLDTLWHRRHGRFVQEDREDFDLHDYMLSLYDDDMRACHYFPQPIRSDLEPIKVGSELEERVKFLETGRHFTHAHSARVNEKPRHLREFSGKFMDVFRSLYVGNGFRHCSSHINFFKRYPGTHYADDAYVLDHEKEKEFVESITSVRYLGNQKVPSIPRNAENWFFTNGWSREHPAFLLERGEQAPVTAYLANTINGEAYREGELLVVM